MVIRCPYSPMFTVIDAIVFDFMFSMCIDNCVIVADERLQRTINWFGFRCVPYKVGSTIRNRYVHLVEMLLHCHSSCSIWILSIGWRNDKRMRQCVPLQWINRKRKREKKHPNNKHALRMPNHFDRAKHQF